VLSLSAGHILFMPISLFLSPSLPLPHSISIRTKQYVYFTYWNVLQLSRSKFEISNCLLSVLMASQLGNECHYIYKELSIIFSKLEPLFFTWGMAFAAVFLLLVGSSESISIIFLQHFINFFF
jgi:hypothetical protein